MTRFCDELLADKTYRDQVANAEYLDISPVLQMNYTFPVSLYDYEGVLLPWPKVFMEYRVKSGNPLWASMAEGGEAQFGLLLTEVEPAKLLAVGKFRAMLLQYPAHHYLSVEMFLKSQGPKGGRELTSVLAKSFLAYDKSGHALGPCFNSTDEKVLRSLQASLGLTTEEIQEIANQELQAVMLPGIHALSLINCQNVSTQLHRTPAKVAKKRLAKGQPPGVSYRTLVIDGIPLERLVERYGEPSRHNALHLVRGHFVTYTEEKPLFGRTTGRFWRRGHVRGKNTERVVAKDYALSPSLGVTNAEAVHDAG